MTVVSVIALPAVCSTSDARLETEWPRILSKQKLYIYSTFHHVRQQENQSIANMGVRRYV